MTTNQFHPPRPAVIELNPTQPTPYIPLLLLIMWNIRAQLGTWAQDRELSIPVACFEIYTLRHIWCVLEVHIINTITAQCRPGKRSPHSRIERYTIPLLLSTRKYFFDCCDTSVGYRIATILMQVSTQYKMSKYRRFDVSIYQNTERVFCPRFPGIPVLYVQVYILLLSWGTAERKLPCIYVGIKYRNRTYRPVFLFIDIVSNSIPTSISNTSS